MAGNSIIGRFGIDLKSLNSDLQQAKKMVESSAYQTASAMQRAQRGGAAAGKSGGGHGGGSGLANRTVGDAINFATGTSGAVNEVSLLVHNLGASAKVAGGLIVLVKTLEQLATALHEVETANNGLRKTLGQKTKPWWENLSVVPEAFKKGDRLGEMPANSMDAMRKRREQLAEASAKAEASRGFMASVGGYALSGGIGKMLGFGKDKNPIDESLRLQQKADEERLRLDGAIAGTVRDETAAREILVHHSQRAGALALEQLETEQKLAALRDDKSLGPQERKALADQVRAESAIRREAIRHEADAKAREIGVEKDLTAIRNQGEAVSVKSAEVRLKAAQEEMHAARNKEEADAASAKVAAARVDLKFARRDRQALKDEQASAIDVAKIQADADIRHQAALIAEAALLDAKLKSDQYTPDEKDKLQVEYERNQAAQRDSAFAMGNRAFDTGGALIESQQGVGQAEAMKAAAQKLALEKARLSFLQNSPQAGPGAIADQQARVAAMARSYADAAHALARGQREARATTETMALQLQHQDSLAAAVKTQLDYAEKIREAQRDGNTELAAQLEKQKQLALQTSVRNAAEAKQERNGLTLGALAGMGGSAGHQARRINRLETRADRVRRLPNVGSETGVQASDRLRARANSIRESLVRRGVLKPGEAERDKLKTALDESKVLDEIKKNTAKFGANLP